MKNILLLVRDDEGQEARVRAAIDLARVTDGHLTCLDVVALPRAYVDYYRPFQDQPLLEKERERETRNAAELKARLADCGAVWDWSDATGFLIDEVCDAAKLCDIVVLSCDDVVAGDSQTRHLVEEV